MRSGTTLLASILNSQANILCVEAPVPQESFNRSFSSQEQFDCFCSQQEARFIELGLTPPTVLREVADANELPGAYVKHLRNIYSVDHVAFKQTMVGRKPLTHLVADHGFKVLVMRRPTEEILRSWVHRINPDLTFAARRLSSWLNETDHYSFRFLPANAVHVVEFDDLLHDRSTALSSISRFLDYDLSEFSSLPRYHSFNKGREIFEQNSSFPSGGLAGDFRSTLTVRYSDEEIRDVATRVDERRLLTLSVRVRTFALKLFGWLPRKWRRSVK